MRNLLLMLLGACCIPCLVIMLRSYIDKAIKEQTEDTFKAVLRVIFYLQDRINHLEKRK